MSSSVLSSELTPTWKIHLGVLEVFQIWCVQNWTSDLPPPKNVLPSISICYWQLPPKFGVFWCLSHMPHIISGNASTLPDTRALIICHPLHWHHMVQAPLFLARIILIASMFVSLLPSCPPNQTVVSEWLLISLISQIIWLFYFGSFKYRVKIFTCNLDL